MKLRNIPILCALPRIANSLGELLTAEPEEITPSTEEAAFEKMRTLQLEVLRETIASQSLELQALKTAAEPEAIKTEWVLKTAPVVDETPHAVTQEEIEHKLNTLAADEAALVDTPEIPHQAPVERRNGLIPDGRTIDEKLEKTEGMRVNKTPGSSETLTKKNTRKRKKSKYTKKRDNTVVTRQMFDHVMAAFPKFEKLKADNPDVVMNRDVFCRQMNRELGTDKTVSVWSNMWMGRTKREHLPDEADLPKSEEE